MTSPLPPVTHWLDGRERRVGVEVEFGGLELEPAAEVVQAMVGGRIQASAAMCIDIVDTDWGDFRIELDSKPLQEMSEQAQRHRKGSVQALTTEWVLDVARTVVPVELITPPLPFAELPRVDRIAARLAEAGALGTDKGLLHAFGLHFNPEPPALDAQTLLRYLRAFALLEDWLRDREHIDLARRVTPFVSAFPSDYRKLVVAADYRPDLPRLIDDYLTHSPTRNRDLDMLPLFNELDRPRVTAVMGDEAGSARPTFHYRLPNSLVGKPGWSVTDPWRRWLWVERLAGMPDRMEDLGRELIEHLDGLVPSSSAWVERIDRELSILDAAP